MKGFARIALTLGLASGLLANAALADSLRNGRGALEARDVSAGVVYIDNHKFKIGPRTKIHWADGEAVALATLELPNGPHQPGLWPLYPVRFEVLESADGPVLTELTLLKRGE